MNRGISIIAIACVSAAAAWQESPEAAGGRGIALLEDGNPQAAERQFALALQANPRLFEVQNLMGVALERQGKHREAREFFRKAIELRRDYAPAHANLGLNAATTQDYALATTELRWALKLDPGQPNGDELRYDLALALFRRGQYTASLRTLDEIRNEASRDPGYFALAGSNYRELDRVPEAIANLRQAVERDPSNPHYLYDLGLALIRHGDTEEALRRLQAGVGQCPSCANLFAALGVASYVLGKNDEAAGYYENAIRLEPAAADIHVALGDLYTAAAAFEKSGAEYAAAVRLEPDNMDYLGKQGRNWMRLREPAKASAIFEHVLARDSRNAEACFNLGKIANEEGRTRDAVRYLEKAASFDPERAATLYQLTLAYKKSGEPQKAALAMSRFRRMNAANQKD